jgi:hypothetical protein
MNSLIEARSQPIVDNLQEKLSVEADVPPAARSATA